MTPRIAWLVSILLLIRCQPSAPAELLWQAHGRYYTIHWADIDLTVDPTVGGRITALQVHGQEMITGPEQHPKYYGSTLWLSPYQSVAPGDSLRWTVRWYPRHAQSAQWPPLIRRLSEP